MKSLPPDKIRSLPGSNKAKKPLDNHVPVEKHTPDILAHYGLPPDYTYLKHEPEKPLEKWKKAAIDDVVKHYLHAATIGGNPMEPQPNVMCECCMDINDENKRKKTGTHLDNGAEHSLHYKPIPGTKPTTPVVPTVPPVQPSTRKKSKQVRFTHQEKDDSNYDIPFFRSEYEGPEMVVPRHYTGPDPDEDALEARTLFVTHPAKKQLYSDWGVAREVGTYGKERHIAEDVVEASSKYIDSMQRLRKIGHDEEY